MGAFSFSMVCAWAISREEPVDFSHGAFHCRIYIGAALFEKENSVL
jgi:hypothetical protein